eukprot:1156567-Pelagomonas_calceolata.AAC.5
MCVLCGYVRIVIAVRIESGCAMAAKYPGVGQRKEKKTYKGRGNSPNINHRKGDRSAQKNSRLAVTSLWAYLADWA